MYVLVDVAGYYRMIGIYNIYIWHAVPKLSLLCYVILYKPQWDIGNIWRQIGCFYFSDRLKNFVHDSDFNDLGIGYPKGAERKAGKYEGKQVFFNENLSCTNSRIHRIWFLENISTEPK